MTVASTKSYVVYTGDGTTATYALASGGSPILYDETSDFLVYLDGVLKTETTHYSIDTGTDILTFVTAPTDGADIWILRMTPRTQELDLTTNGEFDPEAVEAALDKVTREVQDAYREAEHAWKTEYGVSPGTITAGAENTVAKFDANGNLIEGPSAAQVASAEAYAEYAEEWANKAEDALISTAAGGDGVDDYSSKHFSIKAADQADYAEEWAQSDALISVAAGGDGATDRSSKYWSDIAATLVGSTILDSDFTTNGLMRRTGAGVYDTVTATAAGLALLDDVDSDAQLATLGGGTAGIAAFKAEDADDIRGQLSTEPYVANRTALAALDGSVDVVAFLYEAGRQGHFRWNGADLSTEVASDANEGIYVAPAGDASGASGAWVRVYQAGSIQAKWFGVTGDGVTDDGAAISAAITCCNSLPDDGIVLEFSPDTYLAANGVSTVVARSNFWIRGYGATFKLTSNPYFTFGNASSVFTRGGIIGGHFAGVSADATSRIVKVQGYAQLTLDDLGTDRVAGVAELGVSSSYAAPGFVARNIRGGILDIDGAVGFNCRFGGGMLLHQVRLTGTESSGSIPTIPSDRSTPNAMATTRAVRFTGEGTWDTVNISDCVFGHFQIGLYIVGGSGVNMINWKVANTFFDYCGTNGLYMNPSSGLLNFITFVNCWFIGIDDNSVSIEGTTGGYNNIRFIACEGRQAGKRNWSLESTVMNKVELIGCRGMGANRLSANTGSDQDDLYIGAAGVSVSGGVFGEDGSGYTGISGQQGRYGVTTGANLSNMAMTGVQATGATGAFQISANTALQTNVALRDNRGIGSARPNYAGQGSVSVPTSGVTTNWYGPYDREISIYGGTVTSVTHNGVQISDGSGPAYIRLLPGDTWVVTYSSAPTINFVNNA